MSRHDSKIDRLGEVLDLSLKRLELAPRLDEYGVWPVWNEVVGEPIARNAQPEKIRNGTLFIKVSSPVWMQQLQFMKEIITEKLNHRLSSEVVKNIFFVVGKIDAETQQAAIDRTAQNAPPPDDSPVDEAFLEAIKDPQIKQAFKRLMKGYARRGRKP